MVAAGAEDPVVAASFRAPGDKNRQRHRKMRQKSATMTGGDLRLSVGRPPLPDHVLKKETMMSSSKTKYIMMGLTTVIVPLGKMLVQKILARYATEQDAPTGRAEDNTT